MRSSRTGRWSAVLLLALACASCRVTDLRLWTADVPEDDVREVAAVPYYQGPEYDPVRHRLDLYLPRGKSNFPVVVLVHGGAWRRGDNRCCGLYSAVGQFLASQGYGVVMPNYRLSPEVRHPAHITDVARAVAWTRACINEYGGDPERLYLAGHSAGGHLVSLLTTDEKYLAAEGLRPDILKGVLAVSGVYDLPPARQDVVLGGDTPLSFQLRQVAFLRRCFGHAWPLTQPVPGLVLSIDVYGPVFGDDPVGRTLASPIHHVKPGLPPFLILYAQHDLPTLPGMARRFAEALRDQRCPVEEHEVADRNHNSIFFSAIRPDDPTAAAILRFLQRQ